MANEFNKDDMQQFRSTANNYGYENLNWDGKNVTATKNGNSYLFKTDGLTNVNGRLYGTKEQLNNIFSNPLPQVRNTAVSQGVNVGYNQFNQPVLNGQAVATNGMVNSGGNWYMEGNALDDLLSGVAYKEYDNPYQDKLLDYLDQLANYEEFSYDADSDENLQDAMGFARRQAMRNAVERGQGNSYGMEYAANSAANNLIPQYEQKAYDRYINERNYLADLFDMTRGLSQDSLNEFNALETLNETRRHNNAQEDYNNRVLQNEDRDYALRKEDQIFNQGMETRKQDYVEKTGDAEIEDMKADNARADKEVDHRIWYDQATLEQSIKEFEAKHNLNERMWKSEDLLNWAKHKLDGMRYLSENERWNAEQALNLFLATGVATTKTEALLGISAGTKTIDYLDHELNVDTLEWQKKNS